MAANLMHAVQYEAYGGGPAGLKVSFLPLRPLLLFNSIQFTNNFIASSTFRLRFRVQRQMRF